jgi:aryl-alcohol dehydrogenase-like predicted oxidoreductase
MWVPGNKGGESETIIGKWLRQTPGQCDQAVIITKVGTELYLSHRIERQD